MAATTVLAPLEATMSLPAPPASPPCDPVLDSLACLFPDIDRDVLAALLAYQGGDADRAAAALLFSASADNDVAAAADVDAAIAMQMALDIDQQAAISLQMALDAEEAAVRRTQARNVSVVYKAKDMMQRVRSARLTARLTPSGERHARLLDHDGDAAAFDSGSPVESPLLAYEAPVLPPVPPPPADAQPPATTPKEEERYASRVGRARAANQASRRATTTRAASPEASAQQEAAVVPVAELI